MQCWQQLVFILQDIFLARQNWLLDLLSMTDYDLCHIICAQSDVPTCSCKVCMYSAHWRKLPLRLYNEDYAIVGITACNR